MRLLAPEQSATALLFLASQQDSVRSPLLHKFPDGNLLTHLLALLSRPRKGRGGGAQRGQDAGQGRSQSPQHLVHDASVAPVEPIGLLSLTHCLDALSRPRKERERKSVRQRAVKQRPRPEPSKHCAKSAVTPLRLLLSTLGLLCY